jgi:hypothetical protein
MAVEINEEVWRVRMVSMLNINDLFALISILQFYEKYQRERMAPSQQKTRTLVEIHLLIVRLCQVRLNQAMELTFEDVGYIIGAIDIFVSQVEQKIPTSKERTDTLKSCQHLKKYIVATLSSSQA